MYGITNLVAIFLVNKISDLPVLLDYWEQKAISFSSFTIPNDNYYPPGAAILLVPFLWAKPHYEFAVYFYFVAAAIVYYLICNKIFSGKVSKIIALGAFTLNPYLLWLCNSGQDTVFELFLLLSFAALLIKERFNISLLPLYFLCLVRPAYWCSFILIPPIYYIRNRHNLLAKIKLRVVVIPILVLLGTLFINQLSFGTPNLSTSSGTTAFFSHNKYYYLSMPKFDMDVFLSKGGNMDPAKVLANSNRFSSIKDIELRAALVSIVENPKSFFLNTFQKVDSYFFAVQKTPQLPGSYYLSEDKKAIVIENERLSWVLIAGNAFYFIYRSLLLVSGIAALTLFVTYFRRKRVQLTNHLGYFLLPYLTGAIPGILYYTESRFKVVSELMLVPLILAIFEGYKRTTQANS